MSTRKNLSITALISDEVCNHISDREAMLSIMIWSWFMSVLPKLQRYRGKLAFLPATSVFKEAQYKDARPTVFFSTRGRRFSSSPIRRVFALRWQHLIPGSIFPVQFSRWKLEPTSMVISPGEVAWVTPGRESVALFTLCTRSTRITVRRCSRLEYQATGEVSWERCINRIATLASSLKMSSFR